MSTDNCWNCMTYQQKFCCKGCGFALYCSQVCQKEHWKSLHRSHCKYLTGKEKLAGSSDNCVSCKKTSVDYKQLHKKDSPGMACYFKYFESEHNLFKKEFVKLLRNNMNSSKTTSEKYEGSSNFPFEFGEITGNYIDYLDKLLSNLQSLLCHL